MKIKAWIPNALTLLRIVVVFGIIFLMVQSQGRIYDSIILTNIIGLTGIVYMTDFLDGKLARRWSVVSAFGEKLDVVADLFYIIATGIILISRSKMPAMIMLLVILEFLIFFGSSMIKATKPAGRLFFFDYCGRITAVYYYGMPLIYLLIGQMDKGILQSNMLYGANLFCVILTVIAIVSRVSLVADQIWSDKVPYRSSLQKHSHKLRQPLPDLPDLHID